MHERKNESYDNIKRTRLLEYLGSLSAEELEKQDIHCKQCKKCDRWLSFNAFSPNRAVRDKLACWCKDCTNKHHRAWARSIPEEKRDYRLRYGFGITLEQYNCMLEEQGHVCACCKNPETHLRPYSKSGEVAPLSVDHNHKTGQVRSLLCHGCNTAYGHLRENTNRILALLAYHERIKNPCYKIEIIDEIRLVKKRVIGIRNKITYDDRRRYKLKHDFDITPEQYSRILEAQNGVCACCGNGETYFRPYSKSSEVAHLCIDHDHQTGKIRALLCHDCNLAYGSLREDKARILALLAYHKRFNAELDEILLPVNFT